MSKKKVYTTILMLSPLLAMYNLPNIESISFLDIALVSATVFWSFDIDFGYKRELRKLIDKNQRSVLFCLYVIVQFLVISLLNNNLTQFFSIGLRTFRFLFYIFHAVFITKYYFDVKFAFLLIKFLAVFSTLFMFLQMYLLKFHDFYLKGYLPFLPIAREELIIFSNNAWNDSSVRVRSIFSEISQYSIVSASYLLLSLSQKRNYKLFTEIFVSIGLLLSVSTLGVGAVLGIWFYWVMVKYFNFKNIFNKKNIKVLSIFAVFLVLYMMLSPSFGLLLDRIARSLTNRFASYSNYLSNLSSYTVIDITFGVRMDLSRLTVWYPSILKIIYFFGVVGLILFMNIFKWLYKISETHTQRVFIIYLLILGLVTEVLIGNFIVMLLPFTLYPLAISENENIAFTFSQHWRRKK